MASDGPWLRLLATPRFERGGARHDIPDSAPGYLLVYLAARADWVRREEVATLMWPDASERAAQHNLRVNLNRLRPLLVRWGVDGALAAEQRRLRLVIATDVAELRNTHAGGEWPTAAAIPEGGFLDSLSFRAFPVLGEWASAERQALLDLWRDALVQAAPGLHPMKMAELARRFRAVDPAEEVVLRILLGALAATDQRAEAAASYRRFAEALQRECGEAPSDDLRQFAARLLGEDAGNGSTRGHADSQGLPLAASPPSARRLHAPRIAGRDEELGALVDENHRVVLLAGDEGMGKTRLLAEAFPRACWFDCRDTTAQAPLAPLIEWLDDQRDSLPPLEGEFGDLRRLMPGDDSGARPPGDAGGDALPSVLAAAAALAESNSAAVVIDDAQWIDGATVRLAMLIAKRGKCRLVVAYRPAQLNDDAVELIAALRDGIDGAAFVALRPLPSYALDTLVGSVTGIRAQELGESSGWLSQRCGGNPFFALELLRSVGESSVAVGDPASWKAALAEAARRQGPSEVPPRLFDLIRRRLRRLDQVAQRVLAAAAIVGDCRHASALGNAAGVSPWALSQALAAATGAGLVDDERFTHDLVREAVLQGIAPAIARLLHGHVAEAYARWLPAEALAHHWWQAGDTVRALQSTIEAVDRARLRGLQAEALPLLDRTLGRPLDSAARGRLLAARALLLQELADAEAAARDAAAALDEALEPEDRARALVVQARLAYQAGSAGRASELLSEAAQSQAGDPDLLRLRAQLALLDGASHRQAEALQREIAALRAVPLSPALIGALTSLGAIHDENGEPERGLRLHQEALNLARKLGARGLQVDVAINLLWCLTTLPGRADEGFAIGEETLTLGEYDGSDTLRNNLAWAYADAGRHREALALYRKLTESSDPSLACIAWSKLVDLQSHVDEDPAARDTAIEQMLAAMPRTDFYVAHASAIVAALNHGSDGQAHRALAWLRPAQRVDPWLQEKLDAAVASRTVGRRS